MTHIPSQLLAYPFEKEQLTWPVPVKNILLLGAQFEPVLSPLAEADWIQSFKPYYDVLENKKLKVFSSLVFDKKYQIALCVLSKQKEEALYQIAQCLNAIEENGLIIVTAMNDAGGKRIDKWFKEFNLKSQSLSKSKCRVIWAYKLEANIEKINQAITQGQQQETIIEGHSYVTQAGVYGWNKIDKGSKFLIENIKDKLSGIGADFGCGYGYLSGEILKKNKIKKLYAIDADCRALECAKSNLKFYEDQTTVEYLWENLTTKLQNIEPLDWVVMNPPFHEGKDIKVDVGQKFIETAFNALKKNGVLYMVANAHLPYEKALYPLFTSFEKIIEEQGFKVFKAIK